jgi:hypothetical protein
MFRDERRCDVWEEIRQHDIRAFANRITPEVLAETSRRTAVLSGRSPLCIGNLVWLGIAAALHIADDFATILQMTLKLLEDQQDFYSTKLGKAKKSGKRREQRRNSKGQQKKSGKSKHCPTRDDPTQVSEEAFVKARRRMPISFWINLIIVLGEEFQQQHHSLLTFRGFRLLAMDGTCINLANWKALKDHFGTAKNARGDQNAQARMVMLQFPLVRVPYHYELCPLDQGESTIARRLSQHLSKNDLVLLDACFWSYGLLWDIQDRQAFFAIPLKKTKLNLKRVRALGSRDQLARWIPKDSRGQWRREKLPKSIELRIITYQVPGFRPQKLVTNVLSVSRIPREDWVRLANECDAKGKFKPGLYHRRWEIETTFRELKVDQGMEGSLRSRTPESIQFEVAGHVVLYFLVRWLMVEAATKRGIDPLRLSFTQALREILAMHPSLVAAQGHWVQVLLRRLLDRIAQHHVPYRPGRRYPRLKQSTNHKRQSKHPRKKANAKSKATKNKATKGHTKDSKKQG